LNSMRNALNALTDELRRLKAAGVKTVAVSDGSVAALKRVIATRASVGGETGLRKTETGKPEVAKAGSEAAGKTDALTAAAKKVPERAAGAETSRPLASTTRTAAVPVAAAAVSTLPTPPVVTLPEGDKAARWEALRQLVTSDATCCANVRAGKKVVLGVGTLDAKIMFVGEAPGAEEEIQGEPFVGPAGQLLTKMIQAMGLKRSDVYIGNIMNWRPQMPTVEGREQVGNRPPTEEEMRYCLPYLRAQIDVVNPDLLVALGSTAAQGLLGFGSFKALGDIRGKWHEFAGKPLMVTYHPSYILRNQSNRSKRMIWEDLLKVMERAELPISEKQRGYFLDR
jgi:uracil-DNA glycosylase